MKGEKKGHCWCGLLSRLHSLEPSCLDAVYEAFHEKNKGGRGIVFFFFSMWEGVNWYIPVGISVTG